MVPANSGVIRRFVSELQLKETFLQHQQALARALLHKFRYLLDHQRTLQPLVDPQKELLLQPYRQMCYQDVLDLLLLQCLEWRAIIEAAHIPSSKSGTAKLLPWELHSASQHQATIALNYVSRPILPRERGALDRIVEYLVGDGPQNRYALICQQCFSHNGMALKEEFEYIESLEEHDVLDNSTEQTDDKTPDTEQTKEVIEQAPGTEEPEEKQEETENEETSMSEAKSAVPRADAIPNPELCGEPLTV
ncbi:hypothetical protein CB1_001284010 [Camelus ferus]|nr:hypothetical protein CB1_001284010 [Camelus ferus]